VIRIDKPGGAAEDRPATVSFLIFDGLVFRPRDFLDPI